jgi:hypothetical protein
MRFTTLGTNFSMATQREIDPAWHLDVRHFQRHESHEEKTFCLRAHGFRPSWLSESHISHIIFFRQKAFNFCQSSSSSFFFPRILRASEWNEELEEAHGRMFFPESLGFSVFLYLCNRQLQRFFPELTTEASGNSVRRRVPVGSGWPGEDYLQKTVIFSENP